MGGKTYFLSFGRVPVLCRSGTISWTGGIAFDRALLRETFAPPLCCCHSLRRICGLSENDVKCSRDSGSLGESQLTAIYVVLAGLRGLQVVGLSQSVCYSEA